MNQLFLKKLSISILCFFLTTTFYAQTFDLSGIHSLEEYQAFLKREDVATALGGLSYLENNVIWNKIALRHAIFDDSEMSLKLNSSVENNAIKCINFLKSTYGDKLSMRTGWIDTSYSFENKYYTLKLMVEDSVESINENSQGELTISFKQQYTIPLAQISNTLDENSKTGKLYFVEINHFNTDYELLLNGIPVTKYTGRHRYMEGSRVLLNPFILDEKPQQLSIKITPGEDENGNMPDAITKDSYFSASLIEEEPFTFTQKEISKEALCNYSEYVTDTIVENGQTRYSSYLGTYQYGRKSLSCDTVFVPVINYKAAGWKNGEDLRKEKELKNKINALYQELANAFKTKNEQKISDLLYQTYEETAVSCYNSCDNRTETLWESWLPLIHHSYRYNVANDFDLVFSEDGKLVYAQPLNQSGMLRVIGKKKAIGFNFYIYKDASSHQLKFIREK